MMRGFVLTMVFLLFGCGSDSKTIYQDGNPPPPTKPGTPGGDSLEAKFAKIEPILRASCLTSGCHANGAIVDLRTAAKFAGSNSKNRVSGGSMPPPQSGPGKAFTAESKAAILGFFN